jgi:hypothetical protein
MSSRSLIPSLIACGAFLFAAGCSDGNSTPSQTTTTLTLVSPAGSATNVSPASPVVLTFSGPMAQGMEGYVDLHQGTGAGAIIPMACSWSADHTTLTCSHPAPLATGATYTVHVGCGMMDANGEVCGLDDAVTHMGGHWLDGGMMGGMHDGHPTNTLDPHWQCSNGRYGMTFTFTTA